MDLVEAGGVEPTKLIENTQLTDFRFPLILPTPGIQSTLARFGTVTPLNGKLSRGTVRERWELQLCLRTIVTDPVCFPVMRSPAREWPPKSVPSKPACSTDDVRGPAESLVKMLKTREMR